MPRRRRTLIQLLQPRIDRRRNLQIILLQKQKVRVALNTHIGQLNPLVVAEAHLLEVLNKAVVVRDMRAGLASDHDVRHFPDLGELVDGAGLEDAGALGRVVWSDFSGGDGRAIGHGWVVLERCVCETARASSGATDAGNGGVSDQRGEGDVAGLDVDVGAQQIGAVVGPDGGVRAAGGVADGVRLADQAEELASGGAHCVLNVGVGGGNGHVGGGESIESGISTSSIARPLGVQRCLGILVEVLWGCEALLVDDVCRPETEGIFGQCLLATAAVACDINDIHLVALIKVV